MLRRVSVQKVVNTMIFLLLTILLALLVFNVSWFNYTPLKYELDTFTYERVLDHGGYDLNFNELNLLEFLSGEPVWALFVKFLNSFVSSEVIFFIIIPFLTLLSYSLYIYRNSSHVFILFLIHPITLMFYLNQLRLAFAFCIFFIIYIVFKKNKNKIFFFSFFLFLLHSSFITFWFVFLFVDYVSSRNKTEVHKISLAIVGSFFLAFLTGPALSIILGFLGDRRAESYNNNIWQTSLLTAFYCLILVSIFYLNFYFNKLKKLSFEQLCTVFFLAMVIFSSFFIGGYPFRFLSAIFPIMVVAFYQLDRVYCILAYSILIFIGFYIGFFQLNWILMLG